MPVEVSIRITPAHVKSLNAWRVQGYFVRISPESNQRKTIASGFVPVTDPRIAATLTEGERTVVRVVARSEETHERDSPPHTLIVVAHPDGTVEEVESEADGRQQHILPTPGRIVVTPESSGGDIEAEAPDIESDVDIEPEIANDEGGNAVDSEVPEEQGESTDDAETPAAS
jgi:hypothetical protein